MGPTVEELNKVLNIKKQIKQSIINRGVEITDTTPFADYPSKIDSIPDNYDNGYSAGLDEGYSNGYSDGYGTGYEEGSANGGDPYYEELYNLRTNNGTNMASMFARTSGELDLRNLDVSKVTNMMYMFDNSSASVNIDGWDTNNVTNMSYMFYSFTGSIDVSKLDTSKVTNVGFMFYYANINKITLDGLSFPSAKSLGNMFYSATGTTLDLSSWDISNITDMDSIFNGTRFTKIDLTGWNTSKVTNMSNIFNTYDNPLEKLIIPDWDMTNVTSSSSFFGYSADYIKNLKFVDLSRSNDATITKIASFLPTRTTTTYGNVLVPENTSQATFDALVAKYWRPLGAALSPVPTSIEIVAELDEIYPGKSTKVYLGACEPWYADPSKVEIVLVSDSSIATIDEDNRVTSTGILGDIVLEARIKDTQEVVGTKTIAVSETDSYPNVVKFRIAEKPESYNTVININGSGKNITSLTYDPITDIYSYDNGAPITSILFNSTGNINELIKLDTSSITRMSNMFNYCRSLTSLDVSNWDTSHVTDMSGMFSFCHELTELDVSNWDTGKVTNMSSMFLECQKLISLGDINNWDTNNVESMASMFRYCYLLTELDLSNWVTNNVRETSSMFSGCTSLTSLNISNFEISQVNYGNLADYMFEGCNSLQELRLDNCSKGTISKIINSYGFPADNNGTIYCKEENAEGLEAPGNWQFIFVPEE